MIHKYKFNNTNFVLDINSGCVHVVDDICFDILDYIPNAFLDYTESYVIKKLENKYSTEEIREAYSELLSLYKNKKIFTEDTYINPEIINNGIKPAPIKAVCLNISHDCNFKCEYCFASKETCLRELMSFDTAKKTIDFLIKNSGSIRNLEVDFFGGEPLLNFDVVKQTVEYARSLENKYNKNFRFTITTNGLLLDDDKIDFINKEMYDVVLSLDGRKEIHDKFRITRAGHNTYDILVPKFQKLVQKRKNGNFKQYYIRATYTKYNLDFSKDIFHIHNLGFNEISIEPVICDFENNTNNNTKNYIITESDLPEILQEHENICKKLIELKKSGSSINFFNFKINLDSGPCINKRLKGCGFGNDYIAVTPNGDIYPCHQLVGEPKFVLENIHNTYTKIFDNNLKKEFLKLSVYHKEECKNCWAKYYCCGGCSSKNYQHNKNLKTPYKLSCEIQKKKIECAIAYNVLSRN